MKSFYFFEIDKEHESELLRKLNNIKWRGTQLKLEIAKVFSRDSFKFKKKKKKFRKSGV